MVPRGGVGDEPVVAVGVEQFPLAGVSGWVEAFDPADHQPAGHVVGFAAEGEAGDRRPRPLGTLRTHLIQRARPDRDLRGRVRWFV